MALVMFWKNVSLCRYYNGWGYNGEISTQQQEDNRARDVKVLFESVVDNWLPNGRCGFAPKAVERRLPDGRYECAPQAVRNKVFLISSLFFLAASLPCCDDNDDVPSLDAVWLRQSHVVRALPFRNQHAILLAL